MTTQYRMPLASPKMHAKLPIELLQFHAVDDARHQAEQEPDDPGRDHVEHEHGEDSGSTARGR